MHQNYLFHVSKNVAELQRNITSDVNGFFTVVLNILQFLAEISVCIVLITFLLVKDVFTTVLIGGLVIVFVVFFAGFFKKVLGKKGEENRQVNAQVAKWILQAFSGIKEIKVGDLTPTRDFNFVTDTCRGFLALAQADGIEGEEVNVATGTEVSMKETLEMIADVMGADVRYIVDPDRLRPSKSEVFRLCGDNRKILSLTQWRPQVTLRQGLEITARWLTDPTNLARYKSDIYNR